MKTKTIIQIFFSFLVLVLGAWAVYEYKQSQTKQEQEIKKSSFLSEIKLKDLKSFRIIKTNEQLSVVHEDNRWLVKKPVKDLASWTEISRWFDELQNQTVQKIQTKGTIQWENYYLDKAPRVEMDLNLGQTVSFSVSKKSSFDGKYFIKKENELLLGEHYFYSEVNDKDFNSFRSTKILPALGHAEKIQIQGKQSFTLKWKDYKWSLDSKQKFPLDSTRLDTFWTDINSMTAQSVKEAVSPSSLKKYSLHKAQLKMILHYPNENKKYILKLSPFQKERAFVSISHRDFILEISKESAQKLLLSKNEIREKPPSKTKKE